MFYMVARSHKQKEMRAIKKTVMFPSAAPHTRLLLGYVYNPNLENVTIRDINDFG
jgi:hypothetical protein